MKIIVLSFLFATTVLARDSSTPKAEYLPGAVQKAIKELKVDSSKKSVTIEADGKIYILTRK